MKRDPDNPRPEYVHIADDLRSQIASGRLKPGDKLSARRKLAEAYGVATGTVDRAVELLVREGTLVAWQRGTFVRGASPEGGASASPGYEAVMEHLQAIRDDLRGLDTRVARLEELTGQAENPGS